MDTLKHQVLTALDAFAHARPGLDTRNYHTAASYRADSRQVTRALSDYRTLRQAVAGQDAITGASILAAVDRGGRLSFTTRPDGRLMVDYRAGQYYPTEYRPAACRLLASALWDYVRESCMPPVSRYRVAHTDAVGRPVSRLFASREEAEAYRDGLDATRMPVVTKLYEGMPAGDWIRDYFKRAFGARLGRRYFD